MVGSTVCCVSVNETINIYFECECLIYFQVKVTSALLTMFFLFFIHWIFDHYSNHDQISHSKAPIIHSMSCFLEIGLRIEKVIAVIMRYQINTNRSAVFLYGSFAIIE